MKTVKYSYTPTPEITLRGINESGMYSITTSKKIIFTLLCLFIIANSVSALIAVAKTDILHIVYIVLGVAILMYVWLLPNFIIKKKVKATKCDESVEIEVTAGELKVSKNGKPDYTVTLRDYRGTKKGEDIFILYHGSGYTPLPTDGLTSDEKADLEEILNYFHNPDYFKSEEETAQNNDPEFAPFVPPDDFKEIEDTNTEPKENEENIDE